MKCTGGSWCNPSANKSTVCFQFRLPAELRDVPVKTAELWIYKEDDKKENTADSISGMDRARENADIFEIAEVAQLDLAGNQSGLFTQRIEVAGGWASADLTLVIKKWVVTLEAAADHNVYISCPTCMMDSRPPVSFAGNQKPFLTISTDYLHKTHRQKRSVNCAPGIEECCRESLNISFADLGWDKWIVQPATYNAYFCKGSCSLPSSVTYGTYYHSVIKQYKQLNPQKREVVSCCTAEKLSPLEIIYTNGKGIYIKSLLSNMIVESCGCA